MITLYKKDRKKGNNDLSIHLSIYPPTHPSIYLIIIIIIIIA